MKYITFFLLFSTTLQAQNTFSLELKNPPPMPTLLAEGTITTFINERDFALSPDGNEIYYTITTPDSHFQTIVFSKRIKNNEWTKPEVVSFAGKYRDLEPALNADGTTLYFSSNRPINGNAPKDFDIWRVRRVDGNWGTPENVGVPVNTNEDEFYPSIARNGNLYFTAAYAGGVGREDIYYSPFQDNQYQNPVVLDTAVNSKMYEFNAFVSPDEKFILFSSFGRKDDTGDGDLYISLKDDQGKWKPSQNLKEINSNRLDFSPFVSPDGKILFFTSERHHLALPLSDALTTYKKVMEVIAKPLNGNGNIYWMDFQLIYSLLKK